MRDRTVRTVFRKTIPALLLFIIIGINGCALQNDVRILEDRLIALERRNLELQQKTAEADREKSQIKSQIRGYSETLEEKEQALRIQSAELQAMSDRLRDEIQALKGKLEETDYLLNQRIKNLENSEKAAARQLERLERHLNLEPLRTVGSEEDSSYPPPSAPQAPDRAVPPSSAPATDPSDFSEEKLYNYARQAFEKGEFQKSREGFHALLQKYPKTSNADSALFWVGESYYREGRYDSAILEYQTVIEKYPKGNKVRDALLKQGFSFFMLGDKASARLILKELIDKYPGTEQAKAARKKLDTF
ncbi:MAG: tol-pal system protein YbgF [Desulfobacterales bacterium]